MGFRIKAEDVSKAFVCEVLERARKTRVDIELGKPHPAKDEIADFLNAAIEAGLVSPPCYQPVVDGEPLTDAFGPTIFATQQSVEEWFLDREMCRESWGERHWKGQAE